MNLSLINKFRTLIASRTPVAMQDQSKPWVKYVDALLIPLIIFFGFYTPYFASGYILGLDEGQHLAAINAFLRRGVPFRDIFIMHGPLGEYFPYWLMKLFGVHLGVLRGYYLFGNILSLVLVFILLRTLVSNACLKYSALFFMLRYPIDAAWITRWGGIRWAPGFGALLLLYLWLRDGRQRHLFLAGVLCGLGFLISQDIGIGVGFSAAVAIFLRSLEGRADGRFTRTLTRDGSGFSLGFVAAVSPLYFYLIFHHVFTEYLRIQIIDTLFLLTRKLPYGPPLVAIPDLPHSITSGDPLAIRSLVFYVIGLAYASTFVWALLNYRKKPLHRVIFLLSLTAYGAIALKAATRDPNGPQFNAILPVVFTILSMFLAMLLGLDTNSGGKTSRISPEATTSSRARLKNFALFLIILTIVLCSRPYPFFKTRLSVLWSKAALDAYVELDPEIVPRAKGVRVPPHQALNINGSVRFLKEHTNENDLIFTFPYEGHIYFLADRQSASRFTVTIFSIVREEYMAEILRDLESKKPRYVVYLPTEYRIMGIPNEQRLRPIWEYIRMNYEFLARYGSMVIFVRTVSEETSQYAEERTGAYNPHGD